MSAATKDEGGSEYTLYGVEVTPVDGGEPWVVQRRFKDFMGLRAALTALMGLGNLPSCWNDVSKARSVTGRHRCAAWPPAFSLFQSRCQVLSICPELLQPPSCHGHAALLIQS